MLACDKRSSESCMCSQVSRDVAATPGWRRHEMDGALRSPRHRPRIGGHTTRKHGQRGPEAGAKHDCVGEIAAVLSTLQLRHPCSLFEMHCFAACNPIDQA